MKAAWIAFAVVLLGAGTWFLLGDRQGAPDKSAAADRSTARTDDRGVEDPSLEGRIARLEREVESLRRQLAITHGATTAYATRRAADDDDDGGDAIDRPRVAAVTPEFDEAVRAVLEREREREREDEVERRRDRAESRAEERLDDLVAQANISTTQRESIGAMWSAERDKALPIIAAAREGDKEWAEARRELEAIRTETDAEVAKMLSEQQYATYEELRPRGPGGGGERRGGRGDRDRDRDRNE